jgi:hypothetical protein
VPPKKKKKGKELLYMPQKLKIGPQIYVYTYLYQHCLQYPKSTNDPNVCGQIGKQTVEYTYIYNGILPTCKKECSGPSMTVHSCNLAMQRE